MPKETTTCAHCGKEFTIYPSDPHKFCSRACYFAHTHLTSENFWERVDQSGGPGACWPWTKGKFTEGYGQVHIDNSAKGAHCIAWELTNGLIPNGKGVLHRCDNPPCCNPTHLFLGTRGENNTDRTRKNRTAKGNRHGNAKLREVDIPIIRQMRASGALLREIGQTFGVDFSTISDIIHGKIWKHVK